MNNVISRRFRDLSSSCRSRASRRPEQQATARPSINISDHSSVKSYGLNIEVNQDEAKVGEALVAKLMETAISSIAEKGFFTVAVPGGSVLKMLGGLKSSPLSAGIDWSRVYLSYVNHKCVPLDDKASTHQKARALFIDALGLDKVICVTGQSDPKVEADAFEAALRSQANFLGTISPSTGLPIFDLMVIGMGADGHIGSLYPNAPATTIKSTPDSNWILPVVKAEGSSSITFSHLLMSSAKNIIICCTGAKKSPAVVKAVELDPPQGEMPAKMIQPPSSSTVTWLMDTDAAGGLSAVKGIKMIRH